MYYRYFVLLIILNCLLIFFRNIPKKKIFEICKLNLNNISITLLNVEYYYCISNIYSHLPVARYYRLFIVIVVFVLFIVI